MVLCNSSNHRIVQNARVRLTHRVIPDLASLLQSLWDTDLEFEASLGEVK